MTLSRISPFLFLPWHPLTKPSSTYFLIGCPITLCSYNSVNARTGYALPSRNSPMKIRMRAKSPATEHRCPQLTLRQRPVDGRHACRFCCRDLSRLFLCILLVAHGLTALSPCRDATGFCAACWSTRSRPIRAPVNTGTYPEEPSYLQIRPSTLLHPRDVIALPSYSFSALLHETYVRWPTSFRGSLSIKVSLPNANVHYAYDAALDYDPVAGRRRQGARAGDQRGRRWAIVTRSSSNRSRARSKA